MVSEDRKGDESTVTEDVGLSSEMERASAIASVIRHQARKTEVRNAIRYSGQKPLYPRLLALAVSSVMAIYVWFGSPFWLEPDPIPLPAVEAEDASVRLAVFLQVQAIEEYRAENGRLPAYLLEVGPPFPGVRYRRLDAQRYLIQGRGERVGLTYASGDSIQAFLGAGESLLEGILNQ